MYTIDSDESEDIKEEKLNQPEQVDHDEEEMEPAKIEEEDTDQDDSVEDEDSEDDIRKVGSEMEEEPSQPQRFYRSSYQPDISLQKKGSKKPLMILILIILALVVLGVIFRHKINGFIKGEPTPTPTPSATLEPSPTPSPLVRSDWSFEVLNGSGVTGQAKKLADKLKELGYPVVKSGNADKDTYSVTEIFVKPELKDKIDAVIVDLKDVIKIASIAGDLKEGTASARIIIGKDYNP